MRRRSSSVARTIAARLLRRSEAGPWRLVALDVDGADLAAGEAPPARLHFRAPVADPAALRAELAHAAAEAGAEGCNGLRSG